MNGILYTTMSGAMDMWNVIESNNASVGFTPNATVPVDTYPPTTLDPVDPEQNSETNS